MLKKYDGKKQGWLRQGKELAVFIILMFVVFRFIIGVSLVNGSSMNPSLKNGDVVVYTRIVPNYERRYRVHPHAVGGILYQTRDRAGGGHGGDPRRIGVCK